MGKKGPVDDLVESTEFYSPKDVIFQLHIWPFAIFYGLFFYFWFFHYGVSEFEFGLIGSFSIAVLQVILSLFCFWSVDVNCFLTCKKESSVGDASLIKVTPTANNGGKELVRLQKEKSKGGEIEIFFTFQKSKYRWNDEISAFESVSYPVDKAIEYYTSWKGYGNQADLQTAEKYFGKNSMVMDIPEFKELFLERATAPFFVFQVFCVLLWCLDSYWYYSVFTLLMLVAFECTLVQQQIRNMSEIRKMGNKPYQVQVFREGKWKQIMSDELVAGDVVCLGRPKDEGQLVPCDLLLLKGSCIVDESMLTGESVPQMKESLENSDYDPKKQFDIDGDGKLHVLFGGTRIVQHTQPAKGSAPFRGHENGCIAYVLRTGFDTAQGKLLRTILFGVKRVTANNLETFLFIMFLLVFAIAASAYLWIEGSKNPERNKYKLFLECTLILTSVVPPELPIELSLAVNSSLIALSKLMVWCTEPFRIPFAGKIDICAFDKTGTLTTDALVVEGIAGLKEGALIEAAEAPLATLQVLASCHALAQLDDGTLIGDPLEKAALAAIDWHLSRGDTVGPKKAKLPGIRIHHRHHFQSALKRMTVVGGYVPPGANESVCFVAVKGAPETLRPMFSNLPADYDSTYLDLSRRGARVLAMGRRELGSMPPGSLREMSRDQLETGLEFAGFVVISCPMKADSKRIVSEILQSSHSVVMITGDNPLTACHVAKVLKFTRYQKTLIFSEENGSWCWQSVHQDMQIREIPEETAKEFVKKYDLCVTGEGFAYLTSKHRKFLLEILPHIRVFARVAPKQKEAVITMLKGLGYYTLMCGDGTNDVGALKHAHTGVAILSSLPETVSKSSKKKEAQNGSTSLSKPEPTPPVRPGRPVPTRQLPGVPVRPVDPRAPVDPKEARRLKAEAMRAKLMDELEKLEEASLVRLGDASIAAPFTSKLSSIECVCHIIKQGRCTLVTTLQMFKILALNALILAYSQSVLYLEGVKFSDGQATLQGLLLAGCFLFISRSKPLKTLSVQRPLPNIFNVYTIMTVLLQFAVHFLCLIFLIQEANARSPPRESEFPDLDKEFEPNLLNSTVYLISMALQVATIAVNYRGHPFMESLTENRPLLYALTGSLSFVFGLALGVIPEMAAEFSIVEFEPEFRSILVKTLAADILLSFILDRVCLFLFGEGRSKL